MDKIGVLEHPFKPYKPPSGGFKGGIRKGDTRCNECGVGKEWHKHHSYRGYGGGDCMYCYEPEHHIVHETVQTRLI